MLLTVAGYACSDGETSNPDEMPMPIDCEQLCSSLTSETPQALRQRVSASCICNNIPQCQAVSDCDPLLPPSCAGAWACINTFCVWECDPVMSGQCNVDADCDMGEPLPDCAQTLHQCIEGQCESICSELACAEQITDYQARVEPFRPCASDGTCTTIADPACAFMGNACLLAVGQPMEASENLRELFVELANICSDPTQLCICASGLEATCVDGICQLLEE
ncbi:MAG: hypothetical protein AAFS10_04315 [Myxococcota bacterium]